MSSLPSDPPTNGHADRQPDSRGNGHALERVLVLGASAGGLDALANLLVQFGSDFPAPVCAVLHVGSAARGDFARSLHRASPMPARLAEDGDALVAGEVLVAPPDHHLLVERDRARVVHGPKENLSRPAIDPLFRSAAAAFGPGAVGVLCSGLLDDGVAGLDTIRQSGGTTFVQDPADADYPDLPRNALESVAVNGAFPIRRMGAAIRHALAAPLPADLSSDARQRALAETEISKQARSDIAKEEMLGEQVPFACPECGGPLWKMDHTGVRRFRCHVGHGYTDTSLANAQEEATERALWAALRSLEERANLLGDMASDMDGHGAGLNSFSERAQTAREHADQLRSLLLSDR